MNILKINKSAIYVIEIDEDSENVVEKNIHDLQSPISRYFSYIVEVSDDVTIEDFMNHLRNHSEVIDACFYSYIQGESIIQYCDLVNKEPEEKYFVDTVELFWATELYEDEYCLFGTFHGMITEKENLHHLEVGDLNSFPLDLNPINNWKHCKMIINETIRVSYVDESNENDIIKLKNKWTLFELLQHFLAELMCYGSLENQQLEIESYKNSQIKYEGFRVDPDFAGKLNKDELVAFISEVETQIEITKNALEVAVEEDDFESANELKKEIEDLTSELEKMNKKFDELKKTKNVKKKK